MLVTFKNSRMPLVLWSLLCVVGLAEPVRHDINEMMYVNIPGGSACFRRLNGTHQFGCSSPFRGANGIIHVLNDSTALDEFDKNAASGPYVVVLRPLLFSKSTMDVLVKNGKVNGVVLAWTPGSTRPGHYSPDDTCPNRNEGYCDANNPWNPDGFGFLVSDIPFPIFVVQDEPHLELINQCYKDFNTPLDSSQLSKPLCMLQLKSHMYGAVNSEVCTRRLVFQMMNAFKYCDPLGSENIVYPMLNHTDTPNQQLIAVVARLDGASLFDGLAPGAMSAVSGTATLIILASIINHLRPLIESHPRYKGVIFMLLNGESFDYIGSQRIVYDMEQGAFMSDNKITLDNIGMVIELSQLGPGKTFYVHRTSDEQATEFADSLLDLPKKLNLSVEFKLSSLSQSKLPPVSLNTFIKANPNVTGIVVSNYDTSFTNRYYNSIYDDATNMNYVNSTGQSDGSVPPKGSVQYNLASAAIVLARGIAKAVNKDDSIIYDIVPSRYVQSMDDVLYCYLESRKCRLFQKLYPALAANARGPEVLSLYVGIPTSVSHMTRATSRVLAYLASPREELSQDNCTAKCSQDDDLCFWIKDDDGQGQCVLSSVRLLNAVSPAFEIENYDWSSGKYSTWTESVWSETSVRLFVQGNSQKEIVVFISGLTCFVASFLLVFFINRKSKSLFSPKLQPENC